MQTFFVSINADKSQFNWLQKLRFSLSKKRYKVQLPEQWEEIHPSKLPLICRELMTAPDNEIKALNICKILSGLPNSVFFALSPLAFVEKIMPLLSWIIETPLDQPYYDHIKHQGKTFVMPGALMKNSTWREYTQADDKYQELRESGEIETLNELTAILLREKSKDLDRIETSNDQRVLLTEWGSSQRAKSFKGLEEDIKFYVLYYFMSCKEAISGAYTEKSGAGGDEGATKDEEDWTTITADIAEAKVFGTLSDVYNTNVHDVFKWLSVKRKRFLKQQTNTIQEQMKQQNQTILNR